MATDARVGRQDHLTHKGNLRQTRYGWLRLTPAYSVHQVAELLCAVEKHDLVLDPFCGTGTTALVCAERGIPCHTTDINPFLVWLAAVKSCTYSEADLDSFTAAAVEVGEAIQAVEQEAAWKPALHQIEKWWDRPTLEALSRVMGRITHLEASTGQNACNLLKVAFCQTIIEHAHVTFGHQSMSFRRRPRADSLTRPLPGFEENPILAAWSHFAAGIAAAARSPIRQVPCVLLADARALDARLDADTYTRVVTSPPYPNRMSYIRELRPYMYWLGFLTSGRAAGELDWQAIGGTWGCATSRLSQWAPHDGEPVPHERFLQILSRISARSDVLSRYVHKYFLDMVHHCRGLLGVVKPEGVVHYIVGNSKFYDVLLPVEEIFASIFENVGFEGVTVRVSRKRTSKKELFEFVVTARKPRKRRSSARRSLA